jgi:hypothetical protein
MQERAADVMVEVELSIVASSTQSQLSSVLLCASALTPLE